MLSVTLWGSSAHRDFSAPDDPTHHAVVERRNQVMEKFIDVAVSKGDLKKEADLEMYCAGADPGSV